MLFTGVRRVALLSITVATAAAVPAAASAGRCPPVSRSTRRRRRRSASAAQSPRLHRRPVRRPRRRPDRLRRARRRRRHRPPARGRRRLGPRAVRRRHGRARGLVGRLPRQRGRPGRPCARARALIVQACRRTGAAATATLTTQLLRLDVDVLPRRRRRAGPLVERHRSLARATFERLEARGLDVTHDVRQRHAPGRRPTAPPTCDAARRSASPSDVEVERPRARCAPRTARSDARPARRRRRCRPAAPTTAPTRTIQAELKADGRAVPRPRPADHAEEHDRSRAASIQVIEIAKDVKASDDGRPSSSSTPCTTPASGRPPRASWSSRWDLRPQRRPTPSSRAILREVRVVVMPLTNPDGYISSRAAPDPTRTASPSEPTGDRRRHRSAARSPTSARTATRCSRRRRRDARASWRSASTPTATTARRGAARARRRNPNDQSYRGAGAVLRARDPAPSRRSARATTRRRMLTIHNVAGLVLRPPGLEGRRLRPRRGRRSRRSASDGQRDRLHQRSTAGSSTTRRARRRLELRRARAASATRSRSGPAGGDFHGDYQTHVVDQYARHRQAQGPGLREAYIHGRARHPHAEPRPRA